MSGNWVVVPKEATEDMVKAGEEWSFLPGAAWSNMLDAAPVCDACDEDQMSSFIQEAYNQGFRDGFRDRYTDKVAGVIETYYSSKDEPLSGDDFMRMAQEVLYAIMGEQ